MYDSKRFLISCTIGFSFCTHAYSDGFENFSRHEELQAHIIVDTGDFEKLDPSIGKIGAADILKLKSNCFKLIGNLGLWNYGKKAGLLLTNKEKIIKIALLEPHIGSVKVQVVSVVQIACPAADSSGLIIDPEQRLKEIKKRLQMRQPN